MLYDCIIKLSYLDLVSDFVTFIRLKIHDTQAMPQADKPSLDVLLQPNDNIQCYCNITGCSNDRNIPLYV